MKNSIPKTIVNISPGKFADLDEVKNAVLQLEDKLKPSQRIYRTKSKLRYVAFVLVFIVAAYALRGFWLAPLIRNKLETLLSTKLQSEIQVGIIEGNYVNYFELYNVTLNEQKKDSASHLNKVSIYFSFWKMIVGEDQWIEIIKVDNGNIVVDLEDYLRTGKSLKLPKSLPALNFTNVDLSMKYKNLTLNFEKFNCTMWSSGRIIADATDIQGNFAEYSFKKSSFEFDARWSDKKLSVDSMVIAGQNIANGVILGFDKAKSGKVSIIGRLELNEAQIYVSGDFGLAPQKENTLNLRNCQLKDVDLGSIASILLGFPVTSGSVTGKITGSINLDLFKQSDFVYDVEIKDAVVNKLAIPILSGVGSYADGILKVKNGNWIQSYKSVKRRLQANSLVLDISGIQAGKIRAYEGEVVLSSDQNFALLKELTTSKIPETDILLKAIFTNNEILVFGTLKDRFGDIVNINRLLISYDASKPINLWELGNGTNFEARIDFQISDLNQFLMSFPELQEFGDFSGKIGGSIVVKGSTDQGKARIALEAQNLSKNDTKIIEIGEVSTFVEWDKAGTSVKIDKVHLVQQSDIAEIQGNLRIPNTDFTFSEIISKNLESLNLALKIKDLSYYSGIFKAELPSGACNISLIANPVDSELGVLSMNMQNLRFGQINLDEFKINASVYRDTIVISELYARNMYGEITGAFSANYANKKHITVAITGLEYFYNSYRLSLSRDTDVIIKEDNFQINSAEFRGNIGEISIAAAIAFEEQRYDLDFEIIDLNGDWLLSVLDVSPDMAVSVSSISVQGSFKGGISDFEVQSTLHASKIKLKDIPEFNTSVKFTASNDFINFSDIQVTDFSRAQKVPLMSATLRLPLNIIEYVGVNRSENRVFKLGEIYAKSSVVLEDLTWLSVFIPDNSRPKGTCAISLTVGGTFANPSADAIVSFGNLDFSNVKDTEFLKFFDVKSSLIQNVQTNLLADFSKCKADFEFKLVDKIINVSQAKLLLQYQNPKKKDAQNLDEIALEGRFNLVGELPDVLLMQDKFRIGEGELNLLGEISNVSRIPVLSSLLASLEGNLQFDFKISSPWVAPRFNGSARFTKGSVRFLGDFQPVDDLSARFVLEDRQLTLHDLRGDSGGAELRGDGEIILTDSNINLNINLIGKSILIKRTQDQVIRADIDISIVNNVSNPKIQGELKFTDSEYSAYFNIFDAITMIDVSNSAGILANSEIDIKLSTLQEIDVSTNIIQGEANVDLSISGTTSDQKIAGEITVSNATMQFPAMKFYFPAIQFKFDSKTDDILISGKGNGSEFGYSVEMELGGKIGVPEFMLKSKPAASNDEILEMILFGTKPPKIQPGQGIAPVQKITLFVPKDLLDRIFSIKTQNKDVILERMEVKEFTNYSKNDREMFLLRFYFASGSDESSEAFAFELERDKYDTLNMGIAFIIRFK